MRFSASRTFSSRTRMAMPRRVLLAQATQRKRQLIVEKFLEDQPDLRRTAEVLSSSIFSFCGGKCAKTKASRREGNR